jgi:hypothetical protein
MPGTTVSWYRSWNCSRGMSLLAGAQHQSRQVICASKCRLVATPQAVEVRQRHGYSRLVMFALRNIKRGEHLDLDYIPEVSNACRALSCQQVLAACCPALACKVHRRCPILACMTVAQSAAMLSAGLVICSVCAP